MMNAYKAGWLEKQGSQILANSAKTCKDEQKTDDKIEPRFHEGEWVVDNDNNFWKVAGIMNGFYILEYGDGWSGIRPSIESADKTFHLWTIQDAKDGDVLAVENRPFIYNGESNPLSVGGYCGITNNGILKIYEESPGYGHKGWTMFDGDIYPATKEQRDTLKKAMADAGWEFDFKTKELKKIKQKSALSKEGENILTAIIYTVRNSGYKHCMGVSDKTMLDWLKSIKDKVQLQPKKEWSEEDEEFLRRAIKATKEVYPVTANWLKSLKQRIGG
jgi:hypothetical protein